MNNTPLIKTFSRSLRNKTVWERSGISARAYLSRSSAHTLAIFPDTLQAATFFQDYKTLYPDLNVFMLNEMPLTSHDESSRALLLERGETLRRWNKDKGVLVATPGALITSC